MNEKKEIIEIYLKKINSIKKDEIIKIINIWQLIKQK